MNCQLHRSQVCKISSSANRTHPLLCTCSIPNRPFKEEDEEEEEKVEEALWVIDLYSLHPLFDDGILKKIIASDIL